MQHCFIRIYPVTDLGKPFPDIEEFTGLTLISMVIEEKATNMKKTGVQLHLKDEHGQDYLVAITGDLFHGLASALKGARERFGDPIV